jgi:5-methylcytosine-specific restriction endonuclease McrBC GTP-binding regulatory subunit McrB
VIYSWNIFSTLIFVQECLKRFGEYGDAFILVYREKDEKETKRAEREIVVQEELVQQFKGYRNPFSSMLIESKNIIFRGAPGTGKSYLAKGIAADIVSNGYYEEYDQLTDEQKKQVEFVQFHPSYDYTDFVEGLRPRVNDDGTMGFELRDGVFKKFVDRARKNYEDSQKTKETIEREVSAQEAMTDFFTNIEFGVDMFQTINGSEFTITSVDDKYINILIPANATANKLCLNMDEVRKMLESEENFEKIKDVTTFLGFKMAQQRHSYDFAVYKAIKARENTVSKANVKLEQLKKYIFIIDEINRGEISKIFGELFFAVDPGYRGRAGEISTQYANLHSDPDDKFFVPENVYIIGTMNDIDRSVDTFDFAMRRRFRFVEIKPEMTLDMLEDLNNEVLQAEAIRRMTALNQEIVAVEELNDNYQIGASYFLKLKTLTFEQLWTDYLEPLLREYVQGMYDEEGIMSRFAKAYGYQKPLEGNVDEATQN